mmetsp:Transcript_1751/g.4419  ORF Transcript_1751/g.4419 Transcript_1751/m.4419 type:complete len:267 (+) Transcript_1751:1844-2644(+)
MIRLATHGPEAAAADDVTNIAEGIGGATALPRDPRVVGAGSSRLRPIRSPGQCRCSLSQEYLGDHQQATLSGRLCRRQGCGGRCHLDTCMPRVQAQAQTEVCLAGLVALTACRPASQAMGHQGCHRKDSRHPQASRTPALLPRATRLVVLPASSVRRLLASGAARLRHQACGHKLGLSPARCQGQDCHLQAAVHLVSQAARRHHHHRHNLRWHHRPGFMTGTPWKHSSQTTVWTRRRRRRCANWPRTFRDRYSQRELSLAAIRLQS